MTQYPLYFRAETTAGSGTQNSWSTQVPHLSTPLIASIPKEFLGPNSGYSPEDLYLLAASNCFVATFKVYAEKSRLEFHQLKIQSQLKMDRDEKGTPWMAEIEFHVQIQVTTDKKDQALRLLNKTSGSCFVLNSMKTQTQFHFQVRTS